MRKDFSLSDFSKWVGDEEPKVERKSRLIGSYVESKISAKRVAARMDADKGNVKEMAIDFRESGGTVLDVEDDNLLIEVSSGTFRIPKFLVRIGQSSGN